MDFVGQKLGRYEIVELIGEGGMANVYKAFDPVINRSVALKILKEEHCEKEEYKKRFIKEGRAAGALVHPNIVTIYDVGTIDDAPYIMMELLKGETLGDLLTKGELLTLEQTLECVIQLADALNYAHSRNVVHRDMKPDNIVFDTTDNRVKIADFGIARLTQTDVSDSTQAGMMLGTPRYMSPEQALGEPVDGRSDLFALGVIMYEMVTGRKAFDADSMTTLILQIVQKDPVPLRRMVASAPRGFEKIVDKLLEKRPEKRYQTGLELKAAAEREMRTMRDAQKDAGSYLPMHVKRTAIMAVIVAVAMNVSSFVILQSQRSLLEDRLIDSGLSLTKFIAVQAAIPVLGEDWISLEALVLDASARDTFGYLVVSDHSDVVRSASDASLVGKPRSIAESGDVVYEQEQIAVTDVGDELFNFTVPVLFNQTRVGTVDVGLSSYSINEAVSTTMRMLILLILAMVLTVSVVVYIFNKITARNLHMVTEAVKLIGRRQYDVRISKKPNDEFGDLFSAFNNMADAVDSLVNADDEPIEPELVAELESEPEHSQTDISGITQTLVSDRTVVKNEDSR